MENYDFSIQDVDKLTNTKNYVVLQAGKGKGEDTSIHINPIEFSYVEGLIWDKHREYGDKVKTKIVSSDCERILTGFKTAKSKLSEYKQGDDIEDILKFDIIQPDNPIIDILDRLADIEILITDLSNWISNAIANEKYILILKKT